MRNINELLINSCSHTLYYIYLQSGERGTPSRRSKSEGPPVVPNGRAYPVATEIEQRPLVVSQVKISSGL